MMTMMDKTIRKAYEKTQCEAYQESHGHWGCRVPLSQNLAPIANDLSERQDQCGYGYEMLTQFHMCFSVEDSLGNMG